MFGLRIGETVGRSSAFRRTLPRILTRIGHQDGNQIAFIP